MSRGKETQTPTQGARVTQQGQGGGGGGGWQNHSVRTPETPVRSIPFSRGGAEWILGEKKSEKKSSQALE